MSLWEKFLRIIYSIAAKPILRRYKSKSLESILSRSLSVLDETVVSEIKENVRRSIALDGGFMDRGGKSDIYYSLFGCFVAEALSLNDVLAKLKVFVNDRIDDPNLTGINLYCGAILHSKLNGNSGASQKLIKKIKSELKSSRLKESNYTVFLTTLTLYYLKDYRALRNLSRSGNSEVKPSTVIAAEAIIDCVNQRSTRGYFEKLKSFYKGTGGFVGVQNSPIEDLLSTAVSLFALNFIEADIKDIKPECLNFVDSLYLNGGFRATELDFDIDIEYTFYGLLALGALS